MSNLAIVGFELNTPPFRVGNMMLVAAFTLQTGAVVLPGWALAVKDDGTVKLLMPRGDRAYRCRFVSKDDAERCLDLVCDRFEDFAGYPPEQTDILAANPAASRPAQLERDY
jgi:hypothetical protein